MDVAKRHVTRKAHADVGMRVCDYPTIQVSIFTTRYVSIWVVVTCVKRFVLGMICIAKVSSRITLASAWVTRIRHECFCSAWRKLSTTPPTTESGRLGSELTPTAGERIRNSCANLAQITLLLWVRLCYGKWAFVIIFGSDECKHTHTHTRTYTHVNTHININIHTHTHTCIAVRQRI